MLNRTLIVLLAALGGYAGFDWWRSKRDVPKQPVIAPAFSHDYPKLTVERLSDGLPTHGQWRGRPVLRDLDGDGHTDFVAAVRRHERNVAGEGIWVWRGDGQGRWQPMLEGLRRDMGYGGAEIGDLDGDGRLDIAFSGHDVPPHVFMNNLSKGGAGSWIPNAEGIDCNVMCLDVGLGDVDGDGDLDLACVGLMPKEGGLYVYAGDGHGGFQRLSELLPRSHYGADVRMVDLDGDGRAEILAATDTGARVWKLGADKTFVDVGKGMVKPPFGGIELALLATELDGAPGLELVSVGLGHTTYASVRIYRQVAGEWQIWGKGLPEQHPWYDAAILQVKGVERPFLALAGKIGIVVVEVQVDGTSRVVGHVTGTLETLNLIAGDVDGDGTEEIGYVDFAGAHVVRVLGLTNPARPEAKDR